MFKKIPSVGQVLGWLCLAVGLCGAYSVEFTSSVFGDDPVENYTYKNNHDCVGGPLPCGTCTGTIGYNQGVPIVVGGTTGCSRNWIGLGTACTYVQQNVCTSSDMMCGWRTDPVVGFEAGQYYVACHNPFVVQCAVPAGSRCFL